MTRIGENTPRKIDIRVIAATNKDLEIEIKEGRFREDLFYRLSVFPVKLPPLRERKDDIPLLAEHFLYEARGRLSSGVPRLHARGDAGAHGLRVARERQGARERSPTSPGAHRAGRRRGPHRAVGAHHRGTVRSW